MPALVLHTRQLGAEAEQDVAGATQYSFQERKVKAKGVGKPTTGGCDPCDSGAPGIKGGCVRRVRSSCTSIYSVVGRELAVSNTETGWCGNTQLQTPAPLACCPVESHLDLYLCTPYCFCQPVISPPQKYLGDHLGSGLENWSEVG